MKLFLKKSRSNVDAIAEYDIESKSFTVLKGSIVSENISHSEKFRGAASIEKARRDIIKENQVIEDVTFRSASTAANFVTGISTNGLVAWKNREGKSLKQVLTERESNE